MAHAWTGNCVHSPNLFRGSLAKVTRTGGVVDRMHIVLVRHGRPTGAVNPVVGAGGFAQWVRRYNQSGVARSSVPPERLKTSFAGFLAVSSRLKRAQQSCRLCLGREPDLRLPILNEMEIPRYKLPLRLPAYVWLYLNRLLWLLGRKGQFESWNEAKSRARQAALQLHELAQEHQQIVVFGHVLTNARVARELLALGWRGQARVKGYWGELHLTRP